MHILVELEISNVEPIPPNATSKIQHVDAGIIASFKRRYQLQDALVRDEQGATDIYKVDQLTAMLWRKAAWEEIPKSGIANCFKHTGLFDNRIQAHTEPDQETEEEAIENEQQYAINAVHICHLMTVEILLNSFEEVHEAHLELTDNGLVELVLCNTDETNPEYLYNEDESVEEILPILVQLNAVSVVGKMLDVDNKDHRAVLKVLRDLQRKIRAEKTPYNSRWLVYIDK